MRMHLRTQLRRILLLLLLLVSTHGFAQGDRTLACTTDFGTRLTCFIEYTVWRVGPVDFAVGVDTLAAQQSHVAPYVATSWHTTDWSATLELATPQYGWLGRPHPIRFSFTLRF
jgi:hypothetical protein